MTGPQVTATAQNNRLSESEALSRFKQYTDDPDVYCHGQFAWEHKLSSEIETAINASLDRARTSNPQLEQELRRRIPMSSHYAGPIVDLIESTTDLQPGNAFSSRKVEVTRILRAHPGAEAAVIEALIGGTERAGTSLYGQITGEYQNGTVFTSGTPEYNRVFRNPQNTALTLLRGLHGTSTDGCFDTLNAVVAHIQRRYGGLKGGVGTKNAVALDCRITPVSRVLALQSPPPDPGFGELVQYTSDIYARNGAVEQMKLCLDRGYFLRAEVLTGWAINQPPRPDHYLLLLAFEANATSDVFCFWDPDSAEAGTIERGFSRLSCVPGPHATPGSRFGSHFARGRFATGTSEDDLKLMDNLGHYRSGQKRYLILRVAPLP